MDTTKEKTEETAWLLQISPKAANGTLVNIRGRNEQEFAEALRLFQKYGPQFGFTSNPAQKTQYVQTTTDASLATVTKLQTKQAPADTDSVTVTIQGASKRTGTGKTGKTWELWTIETDGDKYETFDSKLGFALSKMVGVTLKLNLETKTGTGGKTFTNIKSFEEAAEIV